MKIMMNFNHQKYGKVYQEKMYSNIENLNFLQKTYTKVQELDRNFDF